MTEVLYEDEFGDLGVMEDVYKVTPKKKSTLTEECAKFEPFNIEDKMKQREDSMKTSLEEQGCKVIKVSSKLISKRRYKRRLAKLVKKNKYEGRVF